MPVNLYAQAGTALDSKLKSPNQSPLQLNVRLQLKLNIQILQKKYPKAASRCRIALSLMQRQKELCRISQCQVALFLTQE